MANHFIHGPDLFTELKKKTGYKFIFKKRKEDGRQIKDTGVGRK